MNDVNSLSHTSWNCKYHIVCALKYRRTVFYGQKCREIGEILRTLCNPRFRWKILVCSGKRTNKCDKIVKNAVEEKSG